MKDIAIRAELSTEVKMEQALRNRIELAAARGHARVHWRPQRSRYYLPPNPEAVADHGPIVVSQLLLNTLRLLKTQKPPGKLTDLDLKRWKTFLGSFIEIKVVHLISDKHLVSSPLSVHLEKTMEGYMHTSRSFALKILGTILQTPRISATGSVHAWGEAGFYEVYEALSEHEPQISALKHEATLVTARCLAYSIIAIEDCSMADELLPIKEYLRALQQGAVPIGYDPGKNLYVTDWYTL